MRPEHPAQGLAADPGAAAFVRGRQTPPANAVLAALALTPADCASSHDDHAAIATTMGTDAGGLCISGQDRLRKWVLVSPGESQLGRLARTRKRKAGRDPAQVALRKTGLVEALLDCGHDGDHGGLEPQPNIGRPRHGVCEPLA